MQNLRIVIGGGFGDCLLHTPFIRYFRKSGLYDRIICMAPNPVLELLDYNPYIDQLIGREIIELPIWAAPEVECDVFSPYIQAQPIRDRGEIRFRGEWGWRREPQWNDLGIVRQVALRNNLQLADDSLEVYTSSEDEAWADAFLHKRRRNPIAVLNHRTNAAFKEYPLKQWQAVVDGLAGHVSILDLSPPAEALNNTESLWPLPRLRQTAALFRRVHCVVTLDSFPAHLAAAVGTPAVVLFGPSNPKVYGHPSNVNIRCSSCPPCYHPEEAGCRQSVCMDQIPYTEVIEAVVQCLNRGDAFRGKGA